MIQDQLVEYISSQLKTGVSRETVKSTLVAAGWQTADVEDTLQKVESVKTSQPITAAPTGTMSSSASAASFLNANSTKPSTGPQTIKMSDLISTSDPATTSTVKTTTTSTSSKSFTGSSPVVTAKPGATSFTAKEFTGKTSSSHGALITEVVLGLLIIAIGGLAGYLYFQNSNLSTQIASLNNQSSGAASQLAVLQKSLAASTTAMAAQTTAMTTENEELKTELSFYAAPVGTPANATSTANLTGTVSGGGKTPYLITATYGGKVYLSNSKNATVVSVLAPLVASSTSATFTGVYMPGADSMTLTGVNGSSLQ